MTMDYWKIENSIRGLWFIDLNAPGVNIKFSFQLLIEH